MLQSAIRSASSALVPVLLGLWIAGTGLSAAADLQAASRGDPVKGAARADALFCAGCHGPGGRSTTPEWPSLAGQGQAYMEQQLRLLRARERSSPEMTPIAVTLTDDDISDLSAYYASQSSPPAAMPADTSGAALYGKGDPDRSIQACAACHGPDGRGDNATITPALRSQQQVYVRAQLEAYSRRSRYQASFPADVSRVGLEAMYEIGARLTKDEAMELARHLQSLP